MSEGQLLNEKKLEQFTEDYPVDVIVDTDILLTNLKKQYSKILVTAEKGGGYGWAGVAFVSDEVITRYQDEKRKLGDKNKYCVYDFTPDDYKYADDLLLEIVYHIVI